MGKSNQWQQWFAANKPIYVEVRDRLRADFPDIFDHKKPIPLQIGVALELKEAYPDLADKIKIFLRFWCNRTEYLMALIKAEGRIDLKRVRFPTKPEDRQRAMEQVKRRIANLAKRTKGGSNAASVASGEIARTPS